MVFGPESGDFHRILSGIRIRIVFDIRFSPSNNPHKVKISCSYCKFTSHTEDRCFKKQKHMKN